MKKRWPGKILTSRPGDFSVKFTYKKSEAVVKIKLDASAGTKALLNREQVALSILRGLAVPKRVVIPHKVIGKLFGQSRFCHSATEFIPWPGCFQRPFSAAQALGLWAFVVEQLCAFRRRQVLYTDLKHVHVRLSPDMTQAKIIDFDGCLMVEKNDRYPREAFPYTPELCPPEFYFSDHHGENVVVYQVAMLLGQFLTKKFHNSNVAGAWPKLKKRLKREKQNQIYDLMRLCLSFKPSERPKNLEVLYARLNHFSLPAKSYILWDQLRAPYLKELAKLGLNGPRKATLKAA